MQLTPQQHQAAASMAPVTVAVACPGSGKTQTLVERILKLHQVHGVPFSEMVVVTFTNAAANQLVERVQKRLNVETPPSFAYIGTLHGYCLRIVRKHGSSFGFGTALAVAGDEAANDILDAEVKRKKYNGSAKDLTLAVRKFARLDVGLRPSTKAELVAAAYHRTMRENGLLDFDTLLKIALAVIEANPTIGGTDLMVDEMQDSGDDDAAIYDALSFKRKFYVGDPHQSIYGFRGGSPKHMERLIQEHSYCPIATNFRSVPEIVTAAYRLIQHNPSPGYAMEMQPHREPLGAEAPSLKYVEYRGELDEMMGVAKEIEEALSLGVEPKHIAVLVRTNAVAAEFRKCMEGYGIPLAKKGFRAPTGWDFVTKAAMFAASPDSDYLARWWLSFDHKKDEVDRICMEAGAAFKSVNAYAKCIPASLTVTRFFGALDNILVSGYKDVAEALDVVREIILTNKPETLSDLSFLVTHRTFETPDESGIHVGTIHSAKGLEWPMVWLPSCNQGYLPGKDEEEDRRLFFVAVTRAQDFLTVSWPKERKKYPLASRPDPAEPSQFIAEMKGLQ